MNGNDERELLTLATVREYQQNIHCLELASFTAIEADAAEELCKLKPYLNLSGLTSLPDATAQAFADHRGVLDLSGLTDLSDDAARALSRQKGGLWLNGHSSISDNAAQPLSEHEGDLYLRGLAILSDAGAKALTQHRHFLSFGNLKFVSQVGIKALAKHKGYGLPDPVAPAFPQAPVKGTPDIQPVACPEELLDDARFQHQSVGVFAERIAKGGFFLYRILKPGRATIWISRVGGAWGVHEIGSEKNASVLPSVRKAVEIWLSENQEKPDEAKKPGIGRKS